MVMIDTVSPITTYCPGKSANMEEGVAHNLNVESGLGGYARLGFLTALCICVPSEVPHMPTEK